MHSAFLDTAVEQVLLATWGDRWRECVVTASPIGRVSLGVVCRDHAASRRWIGDRLWFWDRPTPDRVVGVVSSRVSRQWDARREWLARVRSAAQLARRQGAALLACAGSPSAPWVERAADWFASELVWLEEARTWDAWRRALRSKPTRRRRVWLSPQLPTGGSPRITVGSVADRAILGLFPTVCVVHCRRRGSVEALLRERARDWPAYQPITIGSASEPQSEWPRPREPRQCGVQSLPKDYLWHWTRARHDAWPQQTTDQFLDQSLWNAGGSRRDAIGALRRILRTQRLIAQTGSNRGRVATVSFTAQSPDDWSRLRVFRGHRNRWDFEPFGVGAPRAWLQGQGARPVRYGPESQTQSLSSEQRVFFQPERGARDPALDWRREREWRCPSDVDLSRLSSEQGAILAGSPSQAAAIAVLSRWPVFARYDDQRWRRIDPDPIDADPIGAHGTLASGQG